MSHGGISSLQGVQRRGVVDYWSVSNRNNGRVDQSSSSVVDNLVALGDGRFGVMVDIMDRHHTDGVDRVGFMVDHFISLSMDDRNGMDSMYGVVDVGASMVDHLATLSVGRLGGQGNAMDDVGRLGEKVGRSRGPASQDGTDDDLHKIKILEEY